MTDLTPEKLAERHVVDAVIACLPMSNDGTGHVADCGWTDDEMKCGCSTLPSRIGNVVRDALAAEKADLKDAVAALSDTREALAAEKAARQRGAEFRDALGENLSAALARADKAEQERDEAVSLLSGNGRALLERTEKAEADLADMTRQRDEAREVAAGQMNGWIKAERELSALRARIEALADEWTCPDDGMCDDLCESKKFVTDLRAALSPTCECPPCPGRGNDGHGLTHCAECCVGSGVEADPECPKHGASPTDQTKEGE